MKKTFTSLLVLLIASVALNAQTYFSNNFDATPPAPGWVQFNNGIGLTESWALYSNGYSEPYSAGVKYENVASGLAEDYFATPLIDLTSATAPRLGFMANQGFEQNYGSTYHILVSTASQNTIADYTEVASYTETTLGFGWNLKLVDLTAYAGQQIYIAFMMSNDDGDYFFIDDVVVEEAMDNNATLLSTSIERYLTTNQEVALEYVIRNSGSNEITSFQLNWNDGIDHFASFDVIIPSGESVTITHPDAVSYDTVGQHNIIASVSLVNGGADSYPEDNSLTTAVNVISQDGGKKVVFEEGTGTWCGWCPRGMVAMEYMQENYPDTFIGIAVHNGDPMAYAEYNNGAAISAFPGMNVDRKVFGADPEKLEMVSYINQLMGQTPVAVEATATVSGREVSIDAASTFYSNFTNANFRLGVIIVEDGVTGTSAGYAQQNYYSGGSAGPMGGYQNLPTPVPASQMVYDHVGRALLGGYNGQEGSVPTVLEDQQTVNYTFNYTVPANYNLDNMHGVVVLIDHSNGQIVNANTFPIGNLGVNDLVFNPSVFTVYPNPAKDQVNLSIAETGKYNIAVYNTLGQQVLSHMSDVASSRDNVNLNVASLKPGVYIITASTNGKSFSKKLIIK